MEDKDKKQGSSPTSFFKTNGNGFVWIRNIIIINKVCPLVAPKDKDY